MLVLAYVYGFFPLLVLLGLCAWRWGEWPEQAGAGAFILAYVASTLPTLVVSMRFTGTEMALLAVDLVLLVILGRLAIRTGRGWMIWATAFQLLSTSAHLAHWLDPLFRGLAYETMEGASSYPTLIALAVGLITHRRPRPRSAGRS